MDPKRSPPVMFVYVLALILINAHYVICDAKSANLVVNAYPQYGRKMPDTLFGIFFEEINHAGVGGIWAELVNNRGFEAGGQNTPSDFSPWDVIGNKTTVSVVTESVSLFTRNPIALRIDVSCDGNECPPNGVGVYNPGYWGMNIEDGKTYKLTLYVKSSDSINISASLTTSDGKIKLASTNIISSSDSLVSDWTKIQVNLVASGSVPDARLQFTTKKKGTIWLDQVSLMPADTYKGHGFRKDLISWVEDLKPRFMRFPGGCYVEGERLLNAFRWTASIGPWEERSGHYNDIWNYWSDDGLGYFEYLQLAEDLGVVPIWIINNGMSHQSVVEAQDLNPWIEDALNSIEFARGDKTTTWGKIRAQMGHPDPFPLYHMSIGNEDCETWRPLQRSKYPENYMKFYKAIKSKYPDMKIISNCDPSTFGGKLSQPADLYDFHIYTQAPDMFRAKDTFNNAIRTGPKAFVSEYAVWKEDGAKGTFKGALGEAGFLIGLERNSDVVEMASYAPLFVNANHRDWSPDAIVFNSSQIYGTPSYWMQHFFKNSSGAILNPSSIQPDMSKSVIASAITYNNSDDNMSYLKIKVVNYGNDTVNMKITINDLQYSINAIGSSKTVMTVETPNNLMDENSFDNPTKIVPVKSRLMDASIQMDVVISPNSINSFDLQLGQPINDPDMLKNRKTIRSHGN